MKPRALSTAVYNPEPGALLRAGSVSLSTLNRWRHTGLVTRVPRSNKWVLTTQGALVLGWKPSLWKRLISTLLGRAPA